MRPSRRCLLLAAPLAALAPTAACGSDDGATAPAAGAAGGAVFPVRVEHALGTTTVPAAPQRIVCLGWGAQDVLWALGLQPVGAPRQVYGNLPDGTMPWWEGHFDAATTTLTPNDAAGTVPFEAVAALRPDLVLAVYSGITAADHERLEQIAPTVAYAEEPWIGTWQEQARTIGEAVGKAAEAEALVARTEQDLRDRAAATPQLAGKSVAYVYGDTTGLGAYLPGDPRVDTLHALGLVDAPGVTALAATTESFYAEVAKERVRDLDSDVLVGYGDPSTLDSLDDLRADPVYATLPAVAAGAVTWLSDPALIAATSSTVLNLPWQLDRLLPQLAQAADAARA